MTVPTGAFVARTNGKAFITGNSFPKSLDVSKAIDKAAGAEREVIGRRGGRAATPKQDFRGGRLHTGSNAERPLFDASAVTAPGTPEAARWSGWGTALKTMEPYVLARKPLSERTVAANVLRWGTGALNIDATRLPFAGADDDEAARPGGACTAKSGALAGGLQNDRARAEFVPKERAGRWPATVMVADLDVQGPAAGVKVLGEGRDPGASSHGTTPGVIGFSPGGDGRPIAVDGTALDGVLGPYTRHFRIPGTDGTHDEAEVETLVVCPKASTSERERGLQDADIPHTGARKCTHPTVKPVALMRHLVRMVTRPNGVVLDPFCGSGSTGVAAMWEGMRFIGLELNDTDAEPYVRLSRARIQYAVDNPAPEIRARQPKPRKKAAR